MPEITSWSKGVIPNLAKKDIHKEIGAPTSKLHAAIVLIVDTMVCQKPKLGLRCLTDILQRE